MNALLSRQCGTSALLLGPEPVVGTVRDLGELQWRLVTEKDSSLVLNLVDLVSLDEIQLPHFWTTVRQGYILRLSGFSFRVKSSDTGRWWI